MVLFLILIPVVVVMLRQTYMGRIQSQAMDVLFKNPDKLETTENLCGETGLEQALFVVAQQAAHKTRRNVIHNS